MQYCSLGCSLPRVNDLEEQYADRMFKLSDRLSGNDPEDRMRRIAREEADRQVVINLIAMGWIVAVGWLSATYGLGGGLGGLALAAIYVRYKHNQDQNDPKVDRHRAVDMAKDAIRLDIVASGFAAGDQVWSVETPGYPNAETKIVAADDDRWGNFWQRAYNLALELERLSPKQRDKRMATYKARARPALSAGKQLARENDARLIYWAERVAD